MKTCKKCLKDKEYSKFYKDKYNKKDGYKNSCIECILIYQKENKDKILLYQKNYAINNYEKEKLRKLFYRKNNLDKVKESRKKSDLKNLEKIKRTREKYRVENKEKLKESRKKLYEKIENKKEYNKIRNDKTKNYRNEYHQKNKNILREKRREYYLKNIDRIKSESKKYRKENPNKRSYNDKIKRISNPLFKLKENIRGSIRRSIKVKKVKKTSDILGCSFQEFKLYLESKFENWMTWDNYGKYNGELNYGWDIDHIIPSSSAKTEEEIYKLNNYLNLQPLCSKINRDIKKNNII